MSDRFLPGVPGSEIEKIFNAAPGNEIATGKFDSPESSAALAANAFGFFLNRAWDMPPLPCCDKEKWPACSLDIEKTVRFPWRGGRHPVLDVLVSTPSALIGIESKRFEPFRGKSGTRFSCAYWRPKWGDNMKGYESIRDGLHKDFSCLDAAQLVKHAFALRTQVHREGKHKCLKPILFYLYAEPKCWPRTDGRLINENKKIRHREEIERFANIVERDRDEVRFIPCTYSELLADWKRNKMPEIRAHAEALTERFSP